MKSIAIVLLVSFPVCVLFGNYAAFATRGSCYINKVDIDNFYKDTFPASKLALTGNVKNEVSAPLTGVTIIVGNEGKTMTDSLGNFIFLMKEDKPVTLSFSFEKMTTIKRSYHPAMQEKTFSIVMLKDSCKYCLMLNQVLNRKN